MRDVQIKHSDCFIVIYSVTSKGSFVEAREILEKIHELKQTKNVPVLLVGNKIDLEDERSVSEKEGLSLAANFGTGFLEITAKSAPQVNEAFDKAVEIYNLVEMFHARRSKNNNSNHHHSESPPNYDHEKCILQ